MRLIRLAIAAVCAALLAACSTPATRVTLLPQSDGRPSAVVVQSKGGEQTLSQPYARATAAFGDTGAPKLDTADPARVNSEFKPLFELLPPPAQHFTLYFETGDTVLTAASETAVQQLVNAAMSRGGGEIVVTGHTDTTGTPAENDALSRRRAQQVRQMLIARGFPAARIEAVGRGQRDLAKPTGPNVSEPANRRVTVDVR